MHATWKNSVTKENTNVLFHSCELSRKGKSIKTGNKLVVAWGLGWW